MKDANQQGGQSNRETISALILAGGRALRMDGCDKGLVDFRGRPMIEAVLDRLKPQVNLIRINANRSQSDYAHYGYPVIEDRLANYQGPLAGMARGLEDCPSNWMLVVPCDTPFLPKDLVQRLHESLRGNQGEIAVAHDGRRMQPVVALMKADLYPSLARFITSDERKIMGWFRQHRMQTVDFSDCPDGFVNINSLTEKQQFEKQAV